MEFGSYDAGDAANYRYHFPKATIYSVEACKERFKVISSYIDKFDITAFNYAMCDYDGEIEFYQAKDPNVMDNDDGYGSSGSINQKTDMYKANWPHVKEQSPIKTPCRRLDTLCKEKNIEHIDFLHVDVEGAEHKVVTGFGELRPSVLWLEAHVGKHFYGEEAYDRDELNNQVISLGYHRIDVGEEGADILYVHEKDYIKY